MRRVSVRNLAAHKVRLALTVLSVVLGTAFVAGSFVFTDTLKHTFDGLFADTAKGVDVRVTNTQDNSSGVPLTEIDTIRAVQGVRRVETSIGGLVVLLNQNGKAVQGGGAPSEGSAFTPPAQALGDGDEITTGRAPATAGEIALNPGAVKLAKLSVGDRTRVIVPTAGIKEVTLVGVYKTEIDTGGYVGVLFTRAEASALYTDGKHVSAIGVAGDGTSQTVLQQRTQDVLPGYKVETGDQVRADTKNDIDKALSFVNYFLLAFGAIALLVGTFIIYNTFSMIVAQRVRELALLRAIGASRRQVSRSVLLEASLVGLIGSAIGIAAGVGLAYGLRALLNAANFGLPTGALSLKPRTIIVALLVGVVVTLFSAYAPARRASRTPPVAAMREEFASIGTSLRRRTIAALVLTVVGVAALVAGAVADSGGGAAGLVGLGALALIFAVLLGAPALSRPVVGALGAVLTRPFGSVGRLARTNAVRNPRRTAATAFALTLGLMLVSAIAVFGQSAKRTVNALVDNDVTADYILQGPNSIGVPAGAAAAAATVANVASVVTLHPVAVKVNGKDLNGTGVDGRLADVQKLTMLSGVNELQGNDIIVSKTTASDRGWSVGSTVALRTPDATTLTARVVGIYEDDNLAGPFQTSGEFYRQVMPARVRADFVVLVKATPGADLKAMRTDLENVTAPQLVVQVLDREQFKGSVASQIDQLLAILYALLALAIVIAILGIINTLALSVVERRREIGMLRAVGMMRPQVRRTIYLESALIALFGAVVGVALGLVFGALFVHTLRDQGLSAIAVPWGQAGLFLVISGVIGVLAALWPAVRAARTPPLAAIADV
ncbi:MAG: FtsX-like permease family protein [bacterium]